jgi:hypothetical protein
MFSFCFDHVSHNRGISSHFIACASLKGPLSGRLSEVLSPSPSYTALRPDGPREERLGRSGLFLTDDAMVVYGFGRFPAGDDVLDSLSEASKKGLSEG